MSSFANENEFNEITQAMRDKNQIYWTGLKYTGQQPPWRFTDETDPTFAARKVPTPFDRNSGQCIAIKGLNGGRLVQKHCSEGNHYICKIAHAQSSTIQSSQLISTGMSS